MLVYRIVPERHDQYHVVVFDCSGCFAQQWFYVYKDCLTWLKIHYPTATKGQTHDNRTQTNLPSIQ